MYSNSIFISYFTFVKCLAIPVVCLCLWLQSGGSEGETEKDRLLFNCLNTLLKLLRECDLIRDAKWTDDMNLIWGKFRKMKHLARQFKQLSFFGIWLNFCQLKWINHKSSSFLFYVSEILCLEWYWLKLSTLLKLKSINQSSNKLKIDRGPKILK